MRRTWRRTLSMVAAMAIGLAAHLAAQGAPQNGFVNRDTLGPVETLPATPLVFGAYAFAWVALLVYLWSLWRRIGRVERELATVSQALRDRDRKR